MTNNPSPVAPNPCPSCGYDRKPESIGHRHTGTLCFWCGFNSDAAGRTSSAKACATLAQPVTGEEVATIWSYRFGAGTATRVGDLDRAEDAIFSAVAGSVSANAEASVRRGCRRDARAAFSVLRDPSPELVEATARGIDPVAWRVPEPGPIWQAIRRDAARIQARAALTAAVVFLVGDGDA